MPAILTRLLFIALIMLAQPCLATSSQAFTVTSATTSAATVSPGNSITLTAAVQAGSSAGNMIFDMEIYNAAGSKIAQQYYTGLNFSAGQTLSESWKYTVPSAATAGTYTLKIGIFTANWGSLSYWNNGATSFTVALAPPAACGAHASGTTYTLQLSQTSGTTTPTIAQCPYGGTQPTTTTVTQSYSCANGVQTAQGSSVSTTANSGNPTCNAPAACGSTPSGSTVTQTVSTTAGSIAATTAQCPYGGTQPTTTTVTQVKLCTNGTLSNQGNSVSTTVSSGNPTCNAPAACGTHASGTTYTLTTGTTGGTTTPSLSACPYGGTQPTTITTTQSYSCNNGVQTAQGTPVSTTVNNGSPACNAPPVASPAFTLTSARVSAAAVSAGTGITLTAAVQAGSNAGNMIFDMEIYNAAGSKIAQQYYTGLNFSAGQTISESWYYAVPSGEATGVYTLKIGIFTANWGSSTYWNNGATSFTISPAAPAACGGHASGTTYTLTTGTTSGSTTPPLSACPYGGTQPTTTTTTQSYSCNNGVQTAQGSPVSTTVNSGSPDCNASSAGSFGVKILGNKFVSTQDNSIIQFLGVSVSGLEQGATAFNTSPGGYANATNPGFSNMASWNINLVRIPLNEDTWLGVDNCSLDGGSAAALQSNLKQMVANANAAGLYVLLDLHWSAPQSFGCPAGQGAMPDADHSAAFWTSVANTFKDNPAVMFELFNEPFGTNNYSDWIAPINSAAPAGQSASDLGILLNGGTYYDGYMYQCNLAVCKLNNGQLYVAPGSFQTAGMQSMVDAIRATGATNVIISNAMGWAGEIQTWLGAQPDDPIAQLAAGWHEDGGGQSTAASAEAVLNAGYPIIITEAYNNGSNATGYLDAAGVNLFDWAMDNKVGYSYWAWVDWSGGILTDTVTYAPNALGSSLRQSYCSQPPVNSLGCRE